MKDSVKNNAFSILSERESKVLSLILVGKRTNEIAMDLGIKSNTISTYKKNIFFKMRVNSSIELYKLALSEGLIGV